MKEGEGGRKEEGRVKGKGGRGGRRKGRKEEGRVKGREAGGREGGREGGLQSTFLPSPNQLRGGSPLVSAEMQCLLLWWVVSVSN